MIDGVEAEKPMGEIDNLDIDVEDKDKKPDEKILNEL